MDKDLSVYLLVRTDLKSMGDGKGKAQSHHAGFQLAAKHRTDPLVKEYIKLGLEQGADYFNTTITLAANITQIRAILSKLRPSARNNINCVFDTILDPTYPFVLDEEIAYLISPELAKLEKILDNGKVLMTRKEMTCAYFLGDRNDPKFKGLFEGLELYPDKL